MQIREKKRTVNHNTTPKNVKWRPRASRHLDFWSSGEPRHEERSARRKRCGACCLSVCPWHASPRYQQSMGNDPFALQLLAGAILATRHLHTGRGPSLALKLGRLLEDACRGLLVHRDLQLLAG